ncbi:bifunctional ADP-dependent (S)-NAD(P)H-hydrate dehydratase/NAD(P)H-hydrate epimerase [Microlunatus elymi]|uniref:ADP-dependent (S)-NAD(P)H-hydrate dehydratase n=1 Tax=Microlunatus elymi TaxID=2596828 RepID=A0A516PWS3_9ACTN|nr:bifunctional ADP-dependent NAD(P)H-hydrate dehydratase/NAD(P)H-hydrate epimerase [Microlunatus elymi]QDP95592.1 bifunctional ADP-dependent (S)-NAD(P)H-hydrate dehydratase/NAD(P)H-hydrate epimerase [Microlunatus elymi]
MLTAYPVHDIRRLETAAIDADPAQDLMQQAAGAVAAVAAEELARRRGRVYGARVLILVGGGNNGGDALFAGARLARRGARVIALGLLGTPHPGGLAALLAAGGRLLDQDQLGQVDLDGFDLGLDGVLGIGGRPGLPDQVAEIARRLDECDVPVVAVDLPSGVDADTGAVPSAAVRATVTVSFGAAKLCEVIEPAKGNCGRIVRIDLGFRPDNAVTAIDVLDEVDLARRWPYPDARSSKYTRGVVGIDAGSTQYPGAGILATHGAVFSGAGMVRFHGGEEARRVLTGALPNVVYAEGRVQAMLYGSGWGDRSDGAEVISRGLDSGLPGVVDADGLQRLPSRGMSADWLLTPHAGELARLLGCDRSEVEADPLTAAHRGADRTGATVLLKGSTQIVAQPGRRSALIAVGGPAWTAQAGSGDVLAGICTTLLAAGVPAQLAGALAASVQAVAAASLPGPVPPQRLAEQVAIVLGRLQPQPPYEVDHEIGRSGDDHGAGRR